MKPTRDAAALAASLTAAANTSLPLPERAPAEVVAMPQRKEAPAQADEPEGRVVSAQEIMLEVLHRGRPQVQS
jgi:hypothetical protein